MASRTGHAYQARPWTPLTAEDARPRLNTPQPNQEQSKWQTPCASVSIAKNPFMQFVVKGAKAGDKIAVTWVDNKGDKRTDEATVS